jgi:outer membrane biogenesis lipoprotein LolB
MRTVAYRFLFCLIVASTLLSGCISTAPLQAPVVIDNESPQAKALRLAHVAVNEANAALTALNNVIGDNAESEVWTKEQAQAALDESKAYGKTIDRARAALALGDLSEAKTQADLAKTLILALHKRVAQEARK